AIHSVKPMHSLQRARHRGIFGEACFEMTRAPMNVEAILVRLQSVRRNKGGWMARCPAHEDKNPSLSVREEKGLVLLHCFAGCSTDAVCCALKIKVRDLFSKAALERSKEPGIVRETRKQIAGLRSRLAVRDRERGVAVIKTNERNLDFAIARALALAV